MITQISVGMIQEVKAQLPNLAQVAMDVDLTRAFARNNGGFVDQMEGGHDDHSDWKGRKRFVWNNAGGVNWRGGGLGLQKKGRSTELKNNWKTPIRSGATGVIKKETIITYEGGIEAWFIHAPKLDKLTRLACMHKRDKWKARETIPTNRLSSWIPNNLNSPTIRK